MMKNKIKDWLIYNTIYAGVRMAVLSDPFPRSKTPPIKQKAQEDLRIVTYNIKNAYSVKDVPLRYARIPKLCDQLKAYKPDLIGIQEADAPWMGEDETGDLSLNFPKLLSDYAYVGQSRMDDSGEWATIFYLKDKFNLIDSGTFWLSDTPNQPSKTWGSGHNRICTWVTLENKLTGKKFTHLNTHYDTKEISRQKSSDVMLEKVKTLTNPVIMTGDFNLLQGTSVYQKIINAGFEDAKKIAKTKTKFGTLNLYRNHNSRFFPIIDFVFLQKGKCQVRQYQIDNSYRFDGNDISDHFPVIVDFKFK